jgi:hypothetical protein
VNLERPVLDPAPCALDEPLGAAERELDARFLEWVALVLLRLDAERAAARDDAAA